jgi:hypothetical protein
MPVLDEMAPTPEIKFKRSEAVPTLLNDTQRLRFSM